MKRVFFAVAFICLIYAPAFAIERSVWTYTAWDDAEEVGFEEFCKAEWNVEWDGRCDWHTKHGGNYPCSAEASLTFTVGDIEKLHNHLSAELKANPFLSADDIYSILVKQIEADLDSKNYMRC